MTTGLKEFGDIAKKLSVNPLGIIALFIVLVYGIAALVLGISASNFEPGERLPLIWFLVGFPPVVLFTFAWLVAKHHAKLYAPKDFPDPSQFLQTLDSHQQRKRLESELELIEEKKPEEVTKGPEATAITPMSVTIPRRSSMVARLLLAEDLVLRELSSEYGVDISRQLALGPDIGVDGMFAKGGSGFGIEVKFFRSMNNVTSIVESLRRVRDRISRLGWKNFTLILAAVIDDIGQSDSERMKDRISKAAADVDESIQIRFFSFSELLEKYGAAMPE